MSPTDMKRWAKDWAKLRLHTLFVMGQRVGVDVLPRHFYSQVPDIPHLQGDRKWQRPYSLRGIRGTDVGEQLEWLENICAPSLTATLPALRLHQRAAVANGAVGYGPVESDLLYCLIRRLAPRRLVQIGAGASTWVALKAAEDAGIDIEITCVDPYPTNFLTAMDRVGKIKLRETPVQDIPADELADLGAGDVLFIDSTHTVSVGSDVNYVILEVLPRLRKGSLVHFHDVTMPYDYAPSVLSSDLFFWNESVLLQAFLTDNSRFEIRLGCALLHDQALERVQMVLPTYSSPMKTDRGLAEKDRIGAYPTSMWLEVVADPT
ncbi:class I SAM-dependent methyltransferase [Mycobacterium sp. Root135]|uniref:class I SAM-dependent methyltransferase n=1 Tax=Mycobacterium sp. Root135 TaxID=1736457 RepID=UPI000AB236D5|nr:class I SAM-dependent methyltransferase [Mycobacterium sp. Root135]